MWHEHTITIFILNDHVFILCPGGVIAHNMGMLAQHSMGIHLLQSQLPTQDTKEEKWVVYNHQILLPPQLPYSFKVNTTCPFHTVSKDAFLHFIL